MKQFLWSAILVPLLVSPLHAQNAPAGGGKSVDSKDANCGMLYGKGHFLTFCAPKGWVLDNGIWNDQGIYAVFYPVGSNFESAKDSGTIMYINVVGKDDGSTLAGMMTNDAEDVKRRASSAIVKTADPIPAGDTKGLVQLFAPGAFDRYEGVAYFDSPKVIIMFVISSKDPKIFKSDYSAFTELVKSYKFLGSDVTIQKK